jgi:Pyridoxamine 5'-phosphate oxidase
MEPPRSAQQRKKDTLDRLSADKDAWVATAGSDAIPYLVPLSYFWDGATFTLSTPEATPTARNLAASGLVRLGLGPTRDVVLIEGTVETFTTDTVPDEVADAYAAGTRWDPRKERNRHSFVRVTPVRIQAWREVNEIKDRDLMTGGGWLV